MVSLGILESEGRRNVREHGSEGLSGLTRPALGATWSYAPSWTVLLSQDSDAGAGPTFRAQLLKAPSVPLSGPVTCTLLV